MGRPCAWTTARNALMTAAVASPGQSWAESSRLGARHEPGQVVLHRSPRGLVPASREKSGDADAGAGRGERGDARGGCEDVAVGVAPAERR
jgi:hypothetical protein